MSDKNNIVLKRFRKLIEDSGKTRQAVAKDLNCDTSTVTKHFNGDLNISVDYLVKYSKYFNVSSDYLLGLSSAPASNKDENYICSYTGLSLDAIKYLNITKNNLNSAVIGVLEHFLTLGNTKFEYVATAIADYRDTKIEYKDKQEIYKNMNSGISTMEHIVNEQEDIARLKAIINFADIIDEYARCYTDVLYRVEMQENEEKKLAELLGLNGGDDSGND